MSHLFKDGMARAAVTAGLTLSMAFGAIAVPTIAIAAAETGSVTITATRGNAVTYDARQIFKADLLDTGQGTARRVGV